MYPLLTISVQGKVQSWLGILVLFLIQCSRVSDVSFVAEHLQDLGENPRVIHKLWDVQRPLSTECEPYRSRRRSIFDRRGTWWRGASRSSNKYMDPACTRAHIVTRRAL